MTPRPMVVLFASFTPCGVAEFPGLCLWVMFSRAWLGVAGRGKYTIRVLVGRVCAEGMEGWFEVMEQVVSRVKIEVGSYYFDRN